MNTVSRINTYEIDIYVYILLIIFLGFVFQVINYFTADFMGVVYLIQNWYLILIYCAVMAIPFHYIKPIFPRVGMFGYAYIVLLLDGIAAQVFTTGVQYTPFPLIDKYLLAFDQFFHFDSNALINWTFQYPILVKILRLSYAFALFQLLGIPFILVILKKFRRLYHFNFLLISTWFVSLLIYYFFPSIGPFLLISNAHYPVNSGVDIRLFFQVHDFIRPTFNFAGIVSFPSLHVFWILFVLYITWEIKWLFYPLLVINALAFASTLMLGWHYLADVIASVILFFAVLLPSIVLLDKHNGEKL